MDKQRKILVVGYFAAIVFTVLFVPWQIDIFRETYSAKLDLGYSLIIFPPQSIATIDFGKSLLEIMAITAIAGIFYFISDNLKNALIALFGFVSKVNRRGNINWTRKLGSNIFEAGSDQGKQ